METVEAEVRQWKLAANHLIQDSGLINTLKQHGEVQFTGSYHYNLMLSPDIDIYLVRSRPNISFVKTLLSEFINQGWWQSYELGNFFDDKFRIPNWQWLPKGFYIQLKNDYEDRRWKVDIWVLSKSEMNKRSWNTRLTNLSVDQRRAVLELKKARLDGVIDNTVHHIYEAVLYKGVTNIKQFKELDENTQI